MPGCCPPQPALAAGNIYPLYPQASEIEGLNSPPPISEPALIGDPGAAQSRAKPAQPKAFAERARRMDWLAIGLPHNSSHLFARLPFADAIQLAVLVGTGRMTWPEVNLALDAKIKLATAQQRGGRRSALDPHEAWEQARRVAEDEIWARYHAKCDALFADDAPAEEADSWATELRRSRERTLNRLRDERDHALAALDLPQGRRLPTSMGNLTSAERAALRKLDTSGFLGSQAMTDAVRELATPLAGAVERSA